MSGEPAPGPRRPQGLVPALYLVHLDRTHHHPSCGMVTHDPDPTFGEVGAGTGAGAEQLDKQGVPTSVPMARAPVRGPASHIHLGSGSVHRRSPDRAPHNPAKDPMR